LESLDCNPQLELLKLKKASLEKKRKDKVANDTLNQEMELKVSQQISSMDKDLKRKITNAKRQIKTIKNSLSSTKNKALQDSLHLEKSKHDTQEVLSKKQLSLQQRQHDLQD
jgi:hypothetical protein